MTTNAKISFCQFCSIASLAKSFVRVAHENVVTWLLKAKCLPSLYYGLEACPINKSQIKSLNFVLNSAFRKIFAIKSHDAANECIRFFNCSVSGAIYKRKLNFLTKLHQFSESTLCKPFAKNIADELATVREDLCNMWVLYLLCQVVCVLSFLSLLTTVIGE